MKYLTLLLIASCISALASAQIIVQPLTSKEVIRDSIQFQSFKKENPQFFLNNRLPVKLVDGGYVVPGFSTGIQIINNEVKDSVYHNFISNMPDTSTVIPFNDIKVMGSKMDINLFWHLMLAPGIVNPTANITSIDPKKVVNGFINGIKVNTIFEKRYAIKVTLNGKVINGWQPIEKSPKNLFCISQKYKDAGLLSYDYGFHFTYPELKENDTLLVEIKDLSNEWMVDRYNITRVGSATAMK